MDKKSGEKTSGFIKVERSIFDTDIMSHPIAFRLLMIIKKEAIYKNEGVTVCGVYVGRGQWLRSYRNLSKDLEYKEGRGYKKPGLATVKRAVQRLMNYGLVSISETDSGTLFTLLEPQEKQEVSPIEERLAERLPERKRNDSGTLAEQDLRKKKERTKELNNNNESPDSWLEEFEAEHAGNQALIREIEQLYLSKRGLDPEKPTKGKDFNLIVQAVTTYTRDEILEGIEHAFNTSNNVYSFQYCIDSIVSLKEEKTKKKHQKKNVVPFNKQQKKTYNNTPDSKLPIAIREQMEREERERQGIKEPEPSPEVVAKQRAELKKLFEEMGIHREDLA